MTTENVKEILEDTLPTIEKYAPLIGKIIGGTALGAVIDMVIHMLKKTFGVPEYKDTKHLANVIESDPKTPEKLQSLEQENKTLLVKLCNDLHDHHCVTINVHVEKGSH